jgi:glycerol-3-phosphate dehydrogenase subunit B
MTENRGGTDIIVIGAGLAGLTAAVHAVKAGASVRLIAQGWGQQVVTPGWISVCDRADDDVIAEVRGYAALHPEHPYGLAGADGMVDCVERFRAFAREIDLPYGVRLRDGHNLRLMTLLGAIQTPLLAPRGIADGDLTNFDGEVLLVGFTNWRDFYPALAVRNLAEQGIRARAIMVDAPGAAQCWDRWPGEIARALDDPHQRQSVIQRIKPHVQNAAKIGFPAVLGMDRHGEVLDDFYRQLERPCFEIPTLPPSVPGTRLSSRIRRWLLRQRARVQIGHPVVRGIVENGRCQGVEVGALGHANPFYADHVILATGGLYNGGIQSDESGRLWEPIFGLPVQGPSGDGRDGWYRDNLLIHRGHPIHRVTGLCVNRQLQPLGPDGEPVLSNVYAVGHMLAGFNPLTDGCAEGIALASALRAVQVALKLDKANARR